jgi:hypothetical protein
VSVLTWIADGESGTAAIDETKIAVMINRRVAGENVVFIASSFIKHNLYVLAYIIHYRE